MILRFAADGSVTGIVGSMKDGLPIDPGTLGTCTTKRQGVLTEINGDWFADMFLCGGGVLGPFDSRSEAIQGEVDWLSRNVR